jgi:hypothetical protein
MVVSHINQSECLHSLESLLFVNYIDPLLLPTVIDYN